MRDSISAGCTWVGRLLTSELYEQLVQKAAATNFLPRADGTRAKISMERVSPGPLSSRRQEDRKPQTLTEEADGHRLPPQEGQQQGTGGPGLRKLRRRMEGTSPPYFLLC